MFGFGISNRTLANLCQSLGTMLNSGVPIQKSVQLSSQKTSDRRCQQVMVEVTQQIKQGSDLSSAFRKHGTYFPDLFIQMVEVAETSGALPEVLARLAQHYENLLRLRRSFLAAIAWPVIQLLLAIFVVAGLIYILGIVGQMALSQGNEPIDMLGLGLTGASGALTWLFLCFGTIGGLLFGYFLLARGFRQQRLADGLLMKIPVVHGCMQNFAIARFSWVYALTQQTGMPVMRSVRAALKATNNGVFMAESAYISNRLEEGDELSETLRASRLFPEDYLHMVEVAETSGTVPEMLDRLSPDFEERAQRSLSALAVALGWLIWIMVAALIIFIIFRVFLRYVSLINSLGNMR